MYTGAGDFVGRRIRYRLTLVWRDTLARVCFGARCADHPGRVGGGMAGKLKALAACTKNL